MGGLVHFYQNLCDVTAVFTYSHLNTAIDQLEYVYYPNYFIKIYSKDSGGGSSNHEAISCQFDLWFLAVILLSRLQLQL